MANQTKYWSCSSSASELLTYLHKTLNCIHIRGKYPKHQNDYMSIHLHTKLHILRFNEFT